MPKAMRAVPDAPISPASPKALTVAQAAESDNRLQLLIALRSRISKTIDNSNTPPRDLAALSNRLLDIDKEIEQLHAEDSEEAAGGSVSEDQAFKAGDI